MGALACAPSHDVTHCILACKAKRAASKVAKKLLQIEAELGLNRRATGDDESQGRST